MSDSEGSEFNIDQLKGMQVNLKKQIEKAHVNFKKSPKERLSFNYIQTKLSVLDGYWKSFQDNHKLLLRELGRKSQDDDQYSETYFETEDEYAFARDTILTKLEQFRNTQASTSIAQDQMVSATVQQIQLPPIKIPCFDGQYSEWISFHDQFVSLIHQNTSLSNVNKLHFLKQNLVGEAANLLKNISITDNNYEDAWTKLKKRYSNKRVIVNSYLQKLMSLKNITIESASAIKHLLDTLTDCLSGLKNIGIQTNSWDPIIIFLVSNKLDHESLNHWEAKINQSSNEEMPTYDMLVEFLESRFRALEGVQTAKGNIRITKTHNDNKRVFYNSPKENCTVCDGDHYIFKCQQFIKMPLEDKKAFMEKNRLCFNCLIPNHTVKYCRQKTRCRICGKRHHSLIHTETEQPPREDDRRDRHRDSKTSGDPSSDLPHSSLSTHYSTESAFRNTTNVLLATALVKVTAQNGRTMHLRALIDQGSEGSFITESAAQTLGLRRRTINSSISGLGNDTVLQAKHVVTFSLLTKQDTFNLTVTAYVLKSLTRLLPSTQVNKTWNHIQGLQLADPEYGTPARIDLLLGAEVYSQIILDGVVSGPPGTPLAQKTRLGWILSGGVDGDNSHSHILNMHITTHERDLFNLQKFWEIESEDTHKQKIMTEEELMCEKIYEDTHSRDSDGRYIVEIPLKDKNYDFGDTRQIAEKRLIQLEHKLSKNKQLLEEYTRVFLEYLELNHMEEIYKSTDGNSKGYYMPHHAVVRLDKNTSKVRIVFDASCKGPNGNSLNDNMLVGPKLQQDLRYIVMRWRRHEIVFVADCVKMYRQIKVTKESANYQRVLWRVNGEVKEYRLTRVTFGTASAPYLATKTLQQLAIDEEKTFPRASAITRSDFYIDDLLSGVDNIHDACEIYTEITNLMKAGGFELHKWESNNKQFLEHIQRGETETDDISRVKLDETVIKTLGIRWNKVTDNFQYHLNLPDKTEPITKRQILSEISRLFDPMGWLAPVIVTAKIIIQKLWLAGVTWDEEISNELRGEWLQFRENLSRVTDITIGRWLQTNTNDQVTELHGYCDASQAAYAAVVYHRVIKADGSIHVRLVTSKTRVAPIKTISIPRLELCGAVLLAKLLKEVSTHLNIEIQHIHAYTDSSIVLAWLRSHPSRWKTFIANRTSDILTILPAHNWSHVDSGKNPADVASRGVSPDELLHHKLWWSGPSELQKETIEYKYLKENTTNLEIKKEKLKVHTHILTGNKEDFNLLHKYSNLTRLLRVTAYILRVFKRDKPKAKHLTGKEINEAREICIKLCQREEFKNEIERLTKNKNVTKDSRIRTLNPFLDAKGVLRVGGRLQNSSLPEHTKHQIILPERHQFTRLILTDYHIRTLHGGPMLMLSNLRRKYWIVHAKSLIKKIVHQCVKCARFQATTRTQMMGSLPETRVTPRKPFLNSGVDFAGPIDLRLSKGRGCKTQKGYIAIFICMVTRAIHLEIVTSLNTSDFIAAFKRFIARRGHCSDMWSDNATNLSAGSKELKRLFDRSQEKLQSDIKNILANDGTTWHHIPASAPHFGGLWEAGVKSIKFHLKRVLSNRALTYEEMSTLTSQIEACLNSRPISSISDDPTDLLPLTPGHFLIGDAPITVPEEDYLDSKINILTRWQLTQRMLQDFWNRWSKEYLSRLQQRPKWMTKQPNLEIGDLVLLKDDNLPPAKWHLGRILDTHPGADKLVRVVSVQCKNSIYKRPITKICRLPIEQ